MARLHAPLLALSCLILVATGRGETFPEPSPASVTALAFAPDGKTLATGGTDRSVRLWDVSTGRELRCLVGHKEAIFTVLFLPDGKTLVSGSKDGSIILWDATTGEQLRRLVHLQQPLDGLALSADGKLMASVGFRAVALWDMPAGQFLRRMEFDGRSVRQATFLPDGKQLAVVSWDASILIGGIAEGKVLRILKVNTGNDAALHGIRVVGNTFLVGDTRGKAHLYDPVKAEIVRSLKGAIPTVATPIAVSRDGKTLACGGDGNEASLWVYDAATGRERWRARGAAVREALAFSPSGKLLAAVGADGKVQLWDADNGKSLPAGWDHTKPPPAPKQDIVQAPPKPILPLTDLYGDRLPKGAIARLGTARWRVEAHTSAGGFTPDGKGLIINPNWQKEGLLQILDVATGKESMRLQGANYGGGECNLVTCGALMAVSYGGRLDLWEMPAGRLLRQIEVDRNGFVVAIAPDGKTVATGGGGFERGNTNPIKLWDIQSGRLLASFDAHATAIHALAFSADGKRLLSASAEARFGLAGGGTEVVPGAVCVWDAATRKQVARYPNATHGVVFAPGGYSWISQGRDNRLHFFETAGGKQIADIPLPGSTFAFSPDGQVLAATGLGQPISLLGAVEGKEVRRLEGKVGNGWPTLFFAPDGKTLACVTRLNWSVPGGTIRLWDVPSGKEIQPYPVHAHEVACVAQTPDGKTVASGGQDGKLFLWEAATGKRLHRLADHVSGVTALAFSPDGRLLTSGGKHGEVCLWRVADGKELLRLKSGSILSLTFAADGKSIWACSQQGQLQGWDLSGKAMGAFELPARSVHTAALSPVGELLAYSGGVPDEFTGSDTVRICRMTSGKELLTLKLHDRRGREEEPGFEALHCWAVAFSPDGRLLATSESIQTQGLRLILSKHTIRVWELATGKEVLRLADLAVPTKRLAFSPDGRLLAHTHGRMRGWGHGSEDAVFVRDLSAGKSLHQVITDKGEVMCLHSGTELYPIQGHTGQVTCVAFAADGKTLLTGGGDGNVLAWAVERFTPGPGPRPAKVSSEELQALWEQLAGSDAALGYQAIGLLARVPDKTIPFLKERLKPAPAADLKRVGQLILDLEAKSFAVRQKAFSELAGYAEQAEDALRKALPEQRSLEGQRRVQQLLDRLDKIALSPEHLRTLRALTLLERIGTPAARQVLGVLAGGAPTRLTREARASLQRCSR